MTVTLGGNGLIPFDEATTTVDASDIQVDIRDDTAQNVCLVVGTVGSDTDNVYGRFQLRDSSNSNISNARGRMMSSNTTTTSYWNVSALSTNYYGLGYSNSRGSIDGERLSFMLWIMCSQNASNPFFDVSMQGFVVSHGTGSTVYLSRNGNYYRGTADPRKFNFYFNSGNISNASLKSYIIGQD
jgi:hypothetical protein